MEHYKILSLDIWDTILRRDCHPDEIKLATARYLFLTYNGKLKNEFQDVSKLLHERINAERTIAGEHLPAMDDEYRIQDVFYRMLSVVLADTTDTAELVVELCAYELDCEKKHVYLDPTIVNTISQYSFDALGYISDFYGDSQFIDTLLEAVDFPYPVSFKYVSCDYGLNKRSGRLFKLVQEELNVEGNKQLHIGDNPYSDNEVPSRMGIHTLHYVPEKESAFRHEKERYFNVDAGHKYEELLQKMYLGNKTSQKLAPFFTNFILWIAEDCVKRNIKKIYFFTREGEFYSKLFKKIEESDLFPKGTLPHAEILEVSRVATFAASLREPTLKELMRLWNQYSIQAMRGFAKSVALPEKELSPWLNKYKIPIEEVIVYPWLDTRVQNLFADEGFIAFFQHHIHTQREKLKNYAIAKGLSADQPENVAIVDIGWRGTIQDNICYVYPNHHFVGYYLALENFLNEQPENSLKLGYLNGLPSYEYFLRIVSPIEMLCNSENGSTVGYEQQTDGTYRAIRKKEEAEDDIFNTFTQFVQKEMQDSAIHVCEEYSIHSLLSDQMRELTYQDFVSVLLEPQNHMDLVRAFFRLQHNEEFGVGSFVDKHARFRLDLMIAAVFSKKHLRELGEFLKNTSWPQGYLAKYHLSPLIKHYNKRLGLR